MGRRGHIFWIGGCGLQETRCELNEMSSAALPHYGAVDFVEGVTGRDEDSESETPYKPRILPSLLPIGAQGFHPLVFEASDAGLMISGSLA